MQDTSSLKRGTAMGSVTTRDGRSSIIKSDKTTTIYFGEEMGEEEVKASEGRKDVSIKVNKKKWSDLRSKIDTIHEKADVESKNTEKIENENTQEEQAMFRKQVNQVLKKAKKLHNLQRSDSEDSTTGTDRVVIVRSEAQNCSKSVSIVRIRDISHVKLNTNF